MSKLKKTLPKEYIEISKKMPPWSAEDIEKCKELLSECEPDATERGGYKETVLHNIFVPIEIVQWQIERGADVNAPNTYGTPLFKHARSGHYDICKLLLDNYADPEARDYADKTPLYSAADGGHIEIVKLLLERGADPDHHSGRVENCNTPLIYMLSRMTPGIKGKADIAELFLDVRGGKEKIPAGEWQKAQECVRAKGEKFEFAKSGMTDEYRQNGESEMQKLYKLFEVEPPKPIVKHDGVSPIIVDQTMNISQIHDKLWEYLVPPQGKCNTVQGEVIRITGRIGDEVYRNGGINWDGEHRKMLDALKEYFDMGSPLAGADMDRLKEATVRINKSKACGCESDVGVIQELAVKWVSENSDPIRLGSVSYDR